MGSCSVSSKFLWPSHAFSPLHLLVGVTLLLNYCLGEEPHIVNPTDRDAALDPNFDQFWAYPVGRAGYPLNDSPSTIPGPGSNPLFPGNSQQGATAPGGATFFPGPVPGTVPVPVQVGYFSGPSTASSFAPGSYGFNGNGVFGFNIPANALTQQQSNQQSSNWGSGFWSRINPANRFGGIFNFPQRTPVHQYAFSASITNTPNNAANRPQNNPSATSQPYYFPTTYNPQADYKPWYNPAGYVPFGNPFFFSQQNPFNNAGYAPSADQSNNYNKQPSFPSKPSIPVYNPPNVDNSDGSGLQNNTSENSSAFNPNLPVRTSLLPEAWRPGIWGENLRRNWLHVPWTGNLGNRDVSPRTEYPAASLFSFQG